MPIENITYEYQTEIRRTYRHAEEVVDDYLPDSFSFALKKADAFAYAYDMNIDCYKVKELMQQAFFKFSDRFIDIYTTEVESFLRTIQRQEEFETASRLIENYSMEIQSVISTKLSKLIEECFDEFKNTFFRTYASIEPYFKRKLTDLIEEDLENNRLEMSVKISSKFKDVSEEYVRILSNEAQRDLARKKEKDNKDQMIKLINWYNQEFALDENVPESLRKSFEEFNKLAGVYIGQNISLENSSNDFFNELEASIRDFTEELQKYLQVKRQMQVPPGNEELEKQFK